MHKLSTSFVLGYHGCDAKVAEALLRGNSFKPSRNDYDWLGPGVYFWEANPQRGMDFAIEASKRRNSSIKDPAVIGAVIDLGLCLDMTTQGAIARVGLAYENLKDSFDKANQQLPENGAALLLRRLDCVVIRRLHEMLKDLDGTLVDTVRGIFIEGEPLYPDAGFHTKTHTQIAVCNLDCIKGVFRIPQSQLHRGR